MGFLVAVIGFRGGKPLHNSNLLVYTVICPMPNLILVQMPISRIFREADTFVEYRVNFSFSNWESSNPKKL